MTDLPSDNTNSSRGPGRPPLGAAGKTVNKTVRLTKAELEEHERAAKAAGQSWTSWVRAALAAALARPTAVEDE